MKRITILLVLTFSISRSFSQSVGIGTTTPNPKAALEISSTTKGLLIPSMTTAQRLAISAPPEGLLVYDIEMDEYYHADGITWSAILNGKYWNRPIANRARISNTADSVGIGLSSPNEWLDVNGNIRSRSNLMADNDITVAGASFLTGNVNAGSDIIMDNAGATIQMKIGGINKGFFQLSGENTRTGTNSGNTTGKFIIRTNNFDRLWVDSAGNVAIGSAYKVADGYKLSLNGKMMCEEVRVQMDADWPDYVFADDYRLMPLSELEKFLKKNRHLPGILPAAHVKANGLELGDTNKRMMEKIEELTLYILELKKEIDGIKSK